MDLSEEEKQTSYRDRSSIDEPLLPPRYEERTPHGVTKQDSGRSVSQGGERIGSKKRRRGNGRFWTILFFALMGPALLGAFAMFFSNSYYQDGWISNKPHADSGSFPTE